MIGQVGDSYQLRRQYDSLYDFSAIQVLNMYNEVVGYVERVKAAKLAPFLDIINSETSWYVTV